MPDTALAAYRILDFGEVFAGPYATTLLADAGADVIKIESVQRMPAIVRGDRGPAPAARTHTLWGDAVAAVAAAFATLAALHHRARTGRGQFIDLSQAEAPTLFTGAAVLDYSMNGRVSGPTGNREPDMAP